MPTTTATFRRSPTTTADFRQLFNNFLAEQAEFIEIMEDGDIFDAPTAIAPNVGAVVTIEKSDGAYGVKWTVVRSMGWSAVLTEAGKVKTIRNG